MLAGHAKDRKHATSTTSDQTAESLLCLGIVLDSPVDRYLSVQALRLEMACGYDGLLRGKPEPVLLLSTYLGYGDTTRLVDRGVLRFRPRGSFPCTVAPEDPTLVGGTIRVPSSPIYKILAVALEEDGGEDIQRVFGALEHIGELTLWDTHGHEPAPKSLHEFKSTDLSTAKRIQLISHGEDLSTSCRSDKWVGAAALTLGDPSIQQQSVFRFPFRSASGRNDWTAIVQVGRGQRIARD